LFVVEALRLQSSGLELGTRPARLCGLLDDRLAALSESTRALLRVAAVLERQFSPSEVAGVADVSADVCAQALLEALAASLVASEETDVFRFSHVLLRDRLYGELAASRGSVLHLRAGEWLLARGADVESVAHHFFAGESVGGVQRVAEVALAAATAALSRLAFEDAARLGQHALGGARAAQLPARLAGELRLVVAEALMRLERTLEGRTLAVDAAALAEGAGANELLARAALVFGMELAAGGSDEKLRALLRRSLAQLDAGDSALRARLLARLAAALTPPPAPTELAELRELMGAALTMARRLGEPQTLLYVLQFGATVAMLVPEPERFVHLSETIELASALDQRLVLLVALPGYVTALLARGELDRALAELPRYDGLLDEFPQPRHRIRRLLLDSLLGALRGDLRHMESCNREAQQLVQRNGSGSARALWLFHRFCLAQLLSRPELLEEGGAVLALLEPVPRDRPLRACVLAHLGRHAEASEVLLEAELATLEVHSAHLLVAAEVCVRLRDADLAARLYPRLAGASDGLRWNFPGGLIGMTERVLGDLSHLLGRDADAVRHYDRALGLCMALRAPMLAELCQRARDVAAAQTAPKAAAAALRACERDDAAAALSTLRREGEMWSLRSLAGPTLRFKHSKGLEYLRSLLDSPGQSLHV
jgi:hypothetical protein